MSVKWGGREGGSDLNTVHLPRANMKLGRSPPVQRARKMCSPRPGEVFWLGRPFCALGILFSDADTRDGRSGPLGPEECENGLFKRRKARFEGSRASRPSKTDVSRTRRHGMGGQGPWAPRNAKIDFSSAERNDLKVLGPPGLQKPTFLGRGNTGWEVRAPGPRGVSKCTFQAPKSTI